MNNNQSNQTVRNTQLKAWKQTLIIDKRQIQSQNKDLHKLFSFSSSIPQWAQSINKLLKQSEQVEMSIQKQQKKISTKLNDLNSGIVQLKETLKFYQHTNQFLVKVQNLSQNVVRKVQKIKENMSHEFQQLLSTQQSLQNDLKLYSSKIQLIQSGQYQAFIKPQQPLKPPHQKQVKRPYSSKKSSTQMIQPKQKDIFQQKLDQIQRIIQNIKITQNGVQEIQIKINGLGRSLGWNQDDHNDFIKIWNRNLNKNYFQIEDQLTNFFKFYNQEQIRQHMNKHMKQKQLNQQKKQLIIQYKSLKQAKKLKQFQILAIKDQVRQKQQNQHKNIKQTQQQQQMMKQKVVQWKKIKMSKKQQQQRIRIEQQQRREHEKMRRIQQNIARKQAVQKWKQQQQQVKTKRLKQSNLTRKSTIPIQVTERIRTRQQKLVQQKLQSNMRKRYQQQQKLQKQQKLKQKKMIKYSYVNSKLEEKTTSIRQKERDKFDGKDKKEANTFGGNLLGVGVRATPQWMQGL